MEIKVKKLHNEAKLPTYAHSGDVGMDMYALEDTVIPSGGHHIFFVGFAMEFPEGYAAIVKDKGSVSKAGVHTMGGVYDAGYRGEYNVHLVNLSDTPYTVETGDKIAQIIIYPVEIADIQEVNNLSESARGEGRFGSTGKQ